MQERWLILRQKEDFTLEVFDRADTIEEAKSKLKMHSENGYLVYAVKVLTMPAEYKPFIGVRKK